MTETDSPPDARERAFPLGVRVLLVEEARRRRRIETAATALLESAGFEEVILPVVDYADPYAGVIAPASFRGAYRFTDARGELLAIRADFTPMLARAAAPLVRGRDGALRLFYRGDVVRREPVRLGRSRESFQIGAELIGDDSVAADAEIIRLAAAVARECGATPALAISDARLLPLLAARGGGARLAAAVRSRSRAELASLPIDALARPLVEALADGTLTAEMLARFAPAEGIAARLIALRDALCGEAELALDDVADAAYYSGIRFRIYDRRGLVEIGAGGRYDALYGAFGADAPAVGFTITTDALEEASR